MAHRIFKDSFGRSWDVWSVVPERAERRRQAAGSLGDRRHHKEFRAQLREKWVNGWLAFETKGEKRRLAPIPEGWERADDSTLETWCASADVIAGGARRLIE